MDFLTLSFRWMTDFVQIYWICERERDFQSGALRFLNFHEDFVATLLSSAAELLGIRAARSAAAADSIGGRSISPRR